MKRDGKLPPLFDLRRRELLNWEERTLLIVVNTNLAVFLFCEISKSEIAQIWLNAELVAAIPLRTDDCVNDSMGI